MPEPTVRQQQCLALALEHGYHEAAWRLGLAVGTVRWHLHRLYQRLEVTDKWEAACMLGWVRIPAALLAPLPDESPGVDGFAAGGSS